ncbi:MAG: hypothetical protein K9I84_08170 [Leadbetterella sp.]|jgi:hypothetical protein|nr:hypothetical protein [Leadbetterella sp.]
MKFYETPFWLTIPFLVGIGIVILLTVLLAKKNAPTNKKNFVIGSIILFFGAYIFYVVLAGQKGLFQQAMFPPKILLFTTIPYALFLFLVVIKLPTALKIIEKTELSELIGLHIFRLVGCTFIFLGFYDALPKHFAYLAGIGDVLAALSSIFVVYALKEEKKYAKKLAYAWNVFGLADIIMTAILANVLTKISMDTGQMGVDTLARFPFSLIPAIAPPTIIFLHVLIFRKLKNISS